MKLIINIDILILLLNIIVLLTGCFCIGPGIDSRLAVLANTADRESIPAAGPIQKQPVRNTFIK